MVDDLRRSASNDLDEALDASDAKGKKRRRGGLLGMNAFERMILAILLFMLVTVLGVLVLIATNRIVF